MSGAFSALAARLASYGDRVALVEGRSTCSYRELDDASARIATSLLDGRRDLAEARVAFLAPPGVACVATLLGIWRAGAIAVPLAVSHPQAELDYIIRDAEASIVVADRSLADIAAPLASGAGARFSTTDDLMGDVMPAEVEVATTGSDIARRALILYTSGTTGKPKGVVTTHANVAAQITALVSAWAWTHDDRTLLVLPLHHVHGLINVVGSALWAGAACETLPRFDPEAVWERLGSGELTVFTAVPTIYQRLIASWERAPADEQRARSAGCRRLRLMMSGSAALPLTVLERWREISGQTLLERYGMTEIGMALSNPLHGERRGGSVGSPLPGVDVRLVDEGGAPVAPGTPGQIEIRGPGVFREYWRHADSTREAFRDGWFQTGDVAVIENGSYRLLGRRSTDIIKTGGERLSALEIEDVLRQHPVVADCAVVGVPDDAWGERVCVAVELRPDTTLLLDELQRWLKGRLAPAKVPKTLRCVPALPRNAMGKVVKPAVARLFDRIH